jgi:hypothetical protein
MHHRRRCQSCCITHPSSVYALHLQTEVNETDLLKVTLPPRLYLPVPIKSTTQKTNFILKETGLYDWCSPKRNSQDDLEYRVLMAKVKLSLCLTKHHSMKASWREWRYSSNQSLTSALDGGECSASRPGRFNPRERAPDTHSLGDRVGPRAVLNAVVNRKIPSPRRKSNPRTPIVQPVAQHYTDWAINT